MSKFDWLLFDLDNTILDFGKSSKFAFRKLLEEIDSGLNSEELYPIYNEINHKIWEQREAGEISHNDLKWKRWHLFFEQVGIKFDPNKSNDIYFEGIKAFPFFVDHAEEMLQHVKSDFNLMMVTNGLSEVQWPRIRNKNIENYFKHIIISDEIGVAKPQSAFFDHCHALIGDVKKERVLVIGDTLKSDILGGNNYGYTTCWYNYDSKSNETEVQPDFTIDSIKDLSTIL